MYKNLSTGAIGIKNFTLPQSIDLARQTGFEGVDFSITEVKKLIDDHGIEHVRGLFSEIKPGAWGMPVQWQKDEARWHEDLAALPALAEIAQQIGADRMVTWIMPSSEEREFDANLQFHVDRLAPAAEAVKPYGIRLGMEFIGPQTMRPADKHDFIYTLEGMMEMANQIGTGNVGLLLDVWHLYTSGGSVSDMDAITQKDIIAVHVNDAPEGLTLAEYMDLDRRLPMETGVMPLGDFMRKLSTLGYDGPVTAEPFSKRLNALSDPVEAARLTAEYMDQLWQAGGLA